MQEATRHHLEVLYNLCRMLGLSVNFLSLDPSTEEIRRSLTALLDCLILPHAWFPKLGKHHLNVASPLARTQLYSTLWTFLLKWYFGQEVLFPLSVLSGGLLRNSSSLSAAYCSASLDFISRSLVSRFNNALLDKTFKRHQLSCLPFLSFHKFPYKMRAHGTFRKKGQNSPFLCVYSLSSFSKLKFSTRYTS